MIFLTAGVVVLSLLVNGTTIEPLVHYLKLDRPTEASETVFRQSSLSLELSMEKHAHHLKEDPFLCDANWNVVWRYLPLSTAESFFTRLSKGNISLSASELEDVRGVNAEALKKESEPGAMEATKDWVSKGRNSYKNIPYRLRSIWYGYNTKFLFENAGGQPVWGSLKSLLGVAGDEAADSGGVQIKRAHTTASALTGPAEEEAEGVAPPAGDGEEKSGDSAAAKPLEQQQQQQGEEKEEFDGEHHDQNDNSYSSESQRGSLSKRMFQRATATAQKAGVELTDAPNQEAKDSDLIEARIRFLQRLRAEFAKAKRHGKLSSSGLRVLIESIDTAEDKVEKGSKLDPWAHLSGRFSHSWENTLAKYFNWWPAKPLVVEIVALRLSFQVDLAWNFLEAFNNANVKSLLANKGEVGAVQRQVNIEIQKQIDCVEDRLHKLTSEAPLIVLSLKTRTAARIMLEHYREEMETLAENGYIDEKEEEILEHAITKSEKLISYHPTLENLPPLADVLEKVEFLHDLTPEQRKRLIDMGACFYHEYVGEVRLTERGKLGARGAKKNADKDLPFRGWFYVVRGQVEKGWKENGTMQYRNYSLGTLFGMTDAMLSRAHHAGYSTNGFSQLVVFDHQLLTQAALEMPELDYTMWKSVAAHSLRRHTRFEQCKLYCCHGLLGRAAYLSGKSGASEQETIELETDGAIILVSGMVIETQGGLSVAPLGHALTNSAPVLIEPISRGGGGSIKVTGDYKAFKLPSDMLANFTKEERDRMMMQKTMRSESMSLSGIVDDGMDEPADDMGAQQTSHAVSHGAGGHGVAAKVGPKNTNNGARIGGDEAMELMTGVKPDDQ